MVYKITESRVATQYWTYEVEAENEEAALMLVQGGTIDPIDYTVEDTLTDYEIDYEIEEIGDNTVDREQQ